MMADFVLNFQVSCSVVPSSEHEIPANRVLLATRSEVFRAMFAHSTLEASSGRIEITDVDAVVFEQLLAYIYTGFSPNVDALAEELLIAANKVSLQEVLYKKFLILSQTLFYFSGW